MALTPEDNTGLANADSYVDLASFQAYAAARHPELDLTNFDTPTQEAKLRLAFTYINSNWRYRSTPISNNQAGEFPRNALSDGMGRIFNVVPQRVKDAQCEATVIQLNGNDLFVVAARGGMIASEAVGPISTSYQAGASAETLFQVVAGLLLPFVRDIGDPRRPTPSYNDYSVPDDAGPVFSVGMDDNPDNGGGSINANPTQ